MPQRDWWQTPENPLRNVPPISAEDRVSFLAEDFSDLSTIRIPRAESPIDPEWGALSVHGTRGDLYTIPVVRGVHRCETDGSMRACHAAGPGSIPGRDKFPG